MFLKNYLFLGLCALGLSSTLSHAQRLYPASNEYRFMKDNFSYYTESHLEKYAQLKSPLDREEAINPTDVGTMKNAQTLFNALIKGNDNSDCFNRAYVWTYEIWSRFVFNESTKELKELTNGQSTPEGFSKLELKKILIFYPRVFRDYLNNKWGFHIAPSIMVNGELIVLDKQFLKIPSTATKWVDILMNDKLPGFTSELSILKKKQKEYLEIYNNPETKFKKKEKAKYDLGNLLLVKKNDPSFDSKVNNLEEPKRLGCTFVKLHAQFFDWGYEDYCYLLETTMFTSGPTPIENFEKCTLNNNTPGAKQIGCATKLFFNPDEKYLKSARKEAFENYKTLWLEMFDNTPSE